MAERRYVIYALVDPTSHEIRYIGKTCQVIAKRLQKHYLEARKPEVKHHRAQWLRKLEREGLKPNVVILHQCPGNDAACAAERFWIAHYRAAGFDLTNATPGGDGHSGWKHTEESRQRISDALKGRTRSEETKARISAGKKGAQFSEEHRQNLRKASATRRRDGRGRLQ